MRSPEPVSRGKHESQCGRDLLHGKPSPAGKEAHRELQQDDTRVYAVIEPLVVLHQNKLIEGFPDGPSAPCHIVGQLGRCQVLHRTNPPVSVFSVCKIAIGFPVPDKRERIIIRYFRD